MKKIINVIFSQEFLFVLFLNAGFYKLVIPFNDIIDITLLTFLLSFGIAIINILKENKISKPNLLAIFLFSILVLDILLSLFYTNSDQGYLKAFHYATIGGWSFTGPLFIIKHKESLKKFFYSFIILGLITVIAVFRTYGNAIGYFSQQLIFGSDYLAVGRLLGYCVAIITPILLFSAKRKMNKLILFSIMISFVLAMVMTGGRGPFLSMVAAIVILFVSQIRISYKHGIIRYNRYALMGFIIFIVGTIYFIFSDHPLFTNIKTRLSYFFTDQGGTSVSERIQRYHVAFDMFKESPIIGKGIDSFSVYFSIPGDYPHNIFLEFMSELGLIGLCLFVLLLLFALYSFPLKSLNNIQFKLYSWPVVLLFLLSFLNANVSGNIIGNRMLLTAMAMMIAFNQIYKKDENKAIS